MEDQGSGEQGAGRRLARRGAKDSLSKERIVRRELFSHSGPLESAVRGHQRPRFGPAARILHNNPDAPGTLHLPMWTLSRIAPTVTSRRFRDMTGLGKIRADVRQGMRLTSRVFESKGSFQAGFSHPTLAERSVRLRYLGAISRGYWETPLSTPSIASINSFIPIVSRGSGTRQ